MAKHRIHIIDYEKIRFDEPVEILYHGGCVTIESRDSFHVIERNHKTMERIRQIDSGSPVPIDEENLIPENLNN